jgi:hypothetical protein
MLPDPDVLADVVVDTVALALGPVLDRLVAAEARILTMEAKSAVPDVDPDDIAASVAGLLRKELADLPVVARMNKRIVRDARGQITNVIEEPA